MCADALYGMWPDADALTLVSTSDTTLWSSLPRLSALITAERLQDMKDGANHVTPFCWRGRESFVQCIRLWAVLAVNASPANKSLVGMQRNTTLMPPIYFKQCDPLSVSQVLDWRPWG